MGNIPAERPAFGVQGIEALGAPKLEEKFTGFSPPVPKGLGGRPTDKAGNEKEQVIPPKTEGKRQELTTLIAADKTATKVVQSGRGDAGAMKTARNLAPRELKTDAHLPVSEKTAQVVSGRAILHAAVTADLLATIFDLTQFIAVYKRAKSDGNWPPELQSQDARSQAIDEHLQQATETLMNFPQGAKLPDSVHELKKEVMGLQAQVKLLAKPEVSGAEAQKISQEVDKVSKEIASAIGNIAVAKKNVALSNAAPQLQKEIRRVIAEQQQKTEMALANFPKDHILPAALEVIKNKLEACQKALKALGQETGPEALLDKLSPRQQELVKLLKLEKQEYTSKMYKDDLTAFFQKNPMEPKEFMEAWECCALISLVSNTEAELPTNYIGQQVRKFGAALLSNQDPADLVEKNPLLSLAMDAENKYKGSYASTVGQVKYNAERLEQSKAEILEVIQCVGTVCKYKKTDIQKFIAYTKQIFADLDRASIELKSEDFRKLVSEKQEEYQKAYAAYNKGLKDTAESLLKDSTSIVPFISRPAKAKANKLRDAFRAAYAPFDAPKYKTPQYNNLMAVTNLVLDPRIYDVPFGTIKTLKTLQDQLPLKRNQAGLPLQPPAPSNPSQASPAA